ncbi:MAG: hypothetical protein AMXMBFR64_43900 [Myxococcales bacterium]
MAGRGWLLIALLLACDKDDGTRGWAVASSGSDGATSAEDTAGSADTGGSGTQGATDSATGDATAAATSDSAGDTAEPGGDGGVATTDGHGSPAGDSVASEEVHEGVNEPPVFSLMDLNPASGSYTQTLGSGKLSGKLVLAVFHNAADSDSRARAVALEQLRASYEGHEGPAPAIVAINELGTGASITGYVEQGSTTVQFPVLQDTEVDAVWLKFGAERQDMLLLDLQAGLPGAIVRYWTGADQLDPTDSTQRAALQQAIATWLK